MVLVQLRAGGEPASPSKLAGVLGHSSGAIGNALERLVEAGLAERTSDRPRRYQAVDAANPEETET